MNQMSVHFRFGFPFSTNHLPKKSLISFLHPLNLSNQTIPRFSQTLTMATEPSSKRPTCPSCSRPTPVCLCTRIKNPNLNTSVSVTILQHTLEQKHPLSSARIAALGLKNLEVATVSDVNLEARFVIQALEPDKEMGCCRFDETNNGSCESFVLEESLISFKISKNGAMSTGFDAIFDSPTVLGALANGLVVKKFQNKLVNGSSELAEFEEFEVVVPPRSALLFPSEKAVGIENIGFEVKNLIVLDGTWAKAKRIYNENPWLRILPHLKLNLEKGSLYGEVRNQPRAGYLSTIESIVYAMKGLGDKSKGLDHLLEVFESMVGDQRRCKDERLSKISMP